MDYWNDDFVHQSITPVIQQSLNPSRHSLERYMMRIDSSSVAVQNRRVARILIGVLVLLIAVTIVIVILKN